MSLSYWYKRLIKKLVLTRKTELIEAKDYSKHVLGGGGELLGSYD